MRSGIFNNSVQRMKCQYLVVTEDLASAMFSDPDSLQSHLSQLLSRENPKEYT